MLRRSSGFSINIVALCLALALLLSSAGEVRSQRQTPSAKQFPFQTGEELIYKAEFSKGLLRGVDVAEFRFTVSEAQITPKGAAENDPIPAFRFTGDVSSNG